MAGEGGVHGEERGLANLGLEVGLVLGEDNAAGDRRAQSRPEIMGEVYVEGERGHREGHGGQLKDLRGLLPGVVRDVNQTNLVVRGQGSAVQRLIAALDGNRRGGLALGLKYPLRVEVRREGVASRRGCGVEKLGLHREGILRYDGV